MGKKVFFLSFSLLLAFSILSFSAEKGKEALFSKVGIQPVKGNKKAPDFCLESLKGEKSELKDFKGKVVFLNFWATWCGPCKEEMPSMERLHQQFKGKEFTFLSISVDYEGKNSVKRFIERARYTFPVLLDPECSMLDPYDIKRIPTTILIDRNGKMIGKFTGPTNWNSREMVLLVDTLLEK
ncbi:MAG: TlpA family protein disulfide reductase [Thermodesulfobacteriota bacterium]